MAGVSSQKVCCWKQLLHQHRRAPWNGSSASASLFGGTAREGLQNLLCVVAALGVAGLPGGFFAHSLGDSPKPPTPPHAKMQDMRKRFLQPFFNQHKRNRRKKCAI